jgi:hypothetical protein
MDQILVGNNLRECVAQRLGEAIRLVGQRALMAVPGRTTLALERALEALERGAGQLMERPAIPVGATVRVDATGVGLDLDCGPAAMMMTARLGDGFLELGCPIDRAAGRALEPSPGRLGPWSDEAVVDEAFRLANAWLERWGSILGDDS